MWPVRWGKLSTQSTTGIVASPRCGEAAAVDRLSVRRTPWCRFAAGKTLDSNGLGALLASRFSHQGSPQRCDRRAQEDANTAFAAAGIENDGRLGTHTLRKTWARKVYQNSGNDIMILKAALNHSDVSVTQKYLEADEDEVMAAIAKCDFTRAPKVVMFKHASLVA